MEPSTVKVRRAIEELVEQLPALARQSSGMQAVVLAPVISLSPSLAGMVLQRLPEDPAELDAMLNAGAAALLSLRSDFFDSTAVELDGPGSEAARERHEQLRDVIEPEDAGRAAA